MAAYYSCIGQCFNQQNTQNSLVYKCYYSLEQSLLPCDFLV